jgi:parvulin-like peptidyl-prolyl isomerase
MRLSRRTNTIILWIISIGLLVGMVITFTPTLGALSGQGRDTSTPALTVNGETISELELAQARQSSAIFSVVQEGPVAEDLELLLVDSLVRQEVLRQAAARQRVGNGEVRAELEAFRERNGVAGRNNDEAYLRLIGGAGYTDATFRDYLRQQLQVRAYQQEITEGIEVTEAEVEGFYRVNQDAYRTDPRVVARQIVVEDEASAQELRLRALDGEPFAELAREASVERADQGGAVGGEEPQPVGRPAFPTAVADQVFALSAPGLTPVVENAGRYYLVQVEEIVAAQPRPLEEVRDQVREDALAAKQQAALDRRIEELVREAEVSVPEASELSYDDPLVATVGDAEIHASELVRATYTNPQIQQALGPQSASLIVDFFKPSILQQLVDRELAVQGAERLETTFFGSDALIAQSALDWVARDVEVEAAEIEAFYQANLDRYTVPARADVLRVGFGDAEAATDYRRTLLNGAEPEAAADVAGAAVEDLGTVRPGQLDAPLDAALFQTEAFETLPEDPRAVSDVLVLEEPAEEAATQSEPEVEAPAGDEPAGQAPADDAAAGEDATSEDAEADAGDGGAADGDAPADAEADAASAPGDADPADARPAPTVTRHVVLVALRTPERVRPLSEVRADVARTVRAQQRQEAQREWLEGLREEIEVETLLASVPAATPPGTPGGADGQAAEEGAGDPDGEAAAADEAAEQDGADGDEAPTTD